MTYILHIPYLGTFFFSRYPSVALARNERGKETKPGTRDGKPKRPGAREAPSLKYTEIDGVQCYHSDKCQGRDWWTPFLQDCLCTFFF